MKRATKILTVVGTRPDAIKMAPVIKELERRAAFNVINVSSGQHDELLRPLISLFRLRIDHQLAVFRPLQTADDICKSVATRLRRVIDTECPDLVLVQGDTATAMGAALAASARRVPIGHIEAGLRSGDDTSPYPEELYRKHITRLAAFHFAATQQSRTNLLMEGVASRSIFVTGNPIVDALHNVLAVRRRSCFADRILRETRGMRRIVLTMHRRENLHRMPETFATLRHFVETNDETCLIFPVHPNPAVRKAAKVFSGCYRAKLIKPVRYDGFIRLLQNAWVIVTDSGGIQEEAPSLGKHVLLVRSTTERPETLGSVVTLASNTSSSLLSSLRNVPTHKPDDCNPFGNGRSAVQIADCLQSLEA